MLFFSKSRTEFLARYGVHVFGVNENTTLLVRYKIGDYSCADFFNASDLMELGLAILLIINVRIFLLSKNTLSPI